MIDFVLDFETSIMQALQWRFELRPHLVAWMQCAFCVLMAVVLGGDPTGFAGGVCFLFAVLFGIAAWNRCGNMIPGLGIGLFLGALADPVFNTGRHPILAGYAGFIAGGIIGLVIGVFADFVEAEGRRVRVEDSANPTNENQQ